LIWQAQNPLLDKLERIEIKENYPYVEFSIRCSFMW
jgi:hypothetical protein